MIKENFSSTIIIQIVLGCKMLFVPRVYKLVANAEDCLRTICEPVVYKLLDNLATSIFGPVILPIREHLLMYP